jgi:3-oxoacyl-[acyl-carrier protein] reductase
MRKFEIFALLLLIPPITGLATAQTEKSSQADVDKRVDAILSRMTLEEKIDLIGGIPDFFTHSFPKLGISSLKKAADVARLFKEVHSAFGRLDVLVNNAGIFRFGAFAEITEESFHLHYNINVLGAILTVQEAIKRFGADGGSIINLSSIVGSHPVPGALLYASTKGAIETLTRGLALELAPRKIRVNAIAPGHTETEGNLAAGTFEGGAGAVLAGKTPLGRLGRVTDIAPLAVFLASDESAWITGEVIRAAGGLVVAT